MGETRRRRTRTPAPTIRDVARAAQVSVATVSRVLNHPEIVSEEIIARVRSAVEATGFTPNASARALASKSTKAVGVVLPTISSPIYSQIINAMQRTFESRGFVTIVASAEYSLDRELRSATALIERGVDALVLVGRSRHDDLNYTLERKGIPVVLSCIYEPGCPWPTVGWDNRAGARKMANFVADLGHRECGVIGGLTVGNDRASARVDGYISALRERNCNVRAENVIECRYDFGESGEALRALLDRPKPPTAVLCGNDILATGALLECLRLGVRVPDDISIAGYDDLDLSAHLVPSLTTLRIPAERIGHDTAETLVNILAGIPTPLHIGLELELIERLTTAAPRPRQVRLASPRVLTQSQTPPA